MASTGAEVNNEVVRTGQLADGTGQTGELSTLPLQPGVRQLPGLGVDTAGQRAPVQAGAVSQLHLLGTGDAALSPPGQQLNIKCHTALHT